MRERYLGAAVIEQLEGHAQKVFADEAAWSRHLDRLGISKLPHAGSGIHPDPVKIATEGALFGSIQDHGLLRNTVIVSDGAGQFRLDDHADCWIHAERLVHKLDSFNVDQRRAIEIERELIWWLYRDLKLYKEQPCKKTRGSAQGQVQTHLLEKNRLRAARSPARKAPGAQRRSPARARPTGNPAPHQWLRKRHPLPCHQAKNLRRNPVRGRTRCP
jgi:hypothetical protein